MSRIATVQHLAITAITPLHIGAGSDALLDDIDYVSAERIYVIDHERMFTDLSGERLRLAEEAAPLRQLIGAKDLGRLSRYSLPNPTGQGRVPRLLGQIKDAFGRPYLPGSSLKGAIRTALAWALLRDHTRPITQRELGSNPRFADDQLLAPLLGRTPHHDPLRALQVADSSAVPPEASLDLLRVSLYSLRGPRLLPKGAGWSSFVEALRPGVSLGLSLRLDDFLLQPAIARKVDLGRGAALIAAWLSHCRAFGEAVIRYEQSFYANYGPPTLAAFYDDLATQASGLIPGREALIQLAWGTGWLSKTAGLALNEGEVAMIRGQLRLGRVGVKEFPKSRRLVERGGGPSSPLGWVRVRLLDDGDLSAELPPQRTVAAPPTPEVSAATPQPLAPRTLADLRPGMVLEGTVRNIVVFGAFVDVGVRRDGLIHISQLAEGHVARVEDVLHVGQQVRVRVLSVDVAQRKLTLTLKGVE